MFVKGTALVAGLVVVGLAYLGWKLTARGAYESAEFHVIKSDGPFSIREYPNLMMATTSTQFSSQGDDGSFMRLFRYISGSNDRQQKVAMTTPVFMNPEDTHSAGRMGFVIPRKIDMQGAPSPTDDQVKLERRQGGAYAAIRFNGRIDNESLHRSSEKLRDWMTKHQIEGTEPIEFAGYDPPWTPGPFRRNEVLIRLK